ncbi:MAG TPA: hypothetical protein VFA17_02760 [Thermoplasmata archaeon]|nr:hypothetical protein [Thermoplasmata archaeon]
MYSAVALFSSDSILLALFVVYTQAILMVAVGTLLGAILGTIYGTRDGREIVRGLMESKAISRRWRDPTPGRAFIGLAPILGVCIMPVLAYAGVMNWEISRIAMVGLAAFLGMLQAIEAAMRLRAFRAFEGGSGRRIKVKADWTAWEYRVDEP